MGSSRSNSFQLICLSLIGIGSLYAQVNPVPLKNWPAPLSWQATTQPEVAVERERAAEAGKLMAQLAAPGSSTPLAVLVSITPCRLVDTRSSMAVPYGAGGSYPTPVTWAAGSTNSIPVPNAPTGTYTGPGDPSFSPCSLPAAVAYSANITVVPPAGTVFTFLSVCPTGTATSTCSATAALTGYEGNSVFPGNIVANAAVIPANANGSFDVWVNSGTAVVIDINGYYISPSALTLGTGSASAPSLTFSGDSTTGLYSSGAGTVSIATAGSTRLTVAPNGNIGVGTSTPAFPIDVVGTINANNPALSGNANGVQGTSNSPNGAGVNGFNSATTGYPVGIQGTVNGTVGAGIQGTAQQAGAVGIHGNNNATSGFAVGVQGNTNSANGAGVQGATNQSGAYGVNGNNNATSGYAVGVNGNTNSTGGAGVQGNAHNGGAFGVVGFNSATTGFAIGTQGASSSPNGVGLLGVDWNCTGGTGCALVPGTALQLQTATNGTLIEGDSGAAGSVNNTTTVFSVDGTGAGYFGGGVTGLSNAVVPSGNPAVAGVNTATSGVGVGVGGVSSSPSGAGVAGISGTCNNSCSLVTGTAGSFYTSSGSGGYLLQGFSGATGSDFLTGTSQVFYVDGKGDGYFKGNLTVGGNVSKGGGSFRIDHPLDPESKYLYHSFVESPDMKNIYDGVVTLDVDGEATVQLPAWFEALNRDFRYQLTCVGGYAPVYVASKVSGNEFRIAGGRAGLEVSWQLTGVRHDAYANAHRIPVEEEKPASERGIAPISATSAGAPSEIAQHP